MVSYFDLAPRFLSVFILTLLTSCGSHEISIGAPLSDISFVVDEATWSSIDTSPDGKTLILDVLGDIYSLPIEGGDAILIRGGRAWDRTPRFSPNGKQIAYVSDTGDGVSTLWVMNSNGSKPRQVFDGPAMSPAWTSDQNVVFTSSYEAPLQTVDVSSKTARTVASSMGNATGPALSHSGTDLYYASGNIHSVNLRTSGTNRVTEGVLEHFRPKPSPNGRWLVFGQREQYGTSIHVLDLVTGHRRVLVAHSELMIASPVHMNADWYPDYGFLPNSSTIVVSVNGKLQKVDVVTGEASNVPFEIAVQKATPERVVPKTPLRGLASKARILQWIDFSPDRGSVTFSLAGKIWIAGIDDGRARQLTESSEAEFAPRFAPNGSEIVYVSWSDEDGSAVKIVPAAGGDPIAVTKEAGYYTSPVFSPDGKSVAYFRADPLDPDRAFEYQSKATLQLVSRLSGDTVSIDTITVPTSSPVIRTYTPIEFSSDGSRLLFTEQIGITKTLHSIRVDGSSKRDLLRYPHHFDIAIPSPNGERVAFVDRNDVWILEQRVGETGIIDLTIEDGGGGLSRISQNGGSYLDWIDNSTLGWSFADSLFASPIESPRPQKIGSIDALLPKSSPVGKIAFQNGRLLTMRGDKLLDRSTVVVNDDRIESVHEGSLEKLSFHVTSVDLEGKTIVPGLIDGHAHIHTAENEYTPSTRRKYLASLAYGVTTVFDPSTSVLDPFVQRERVEYGNLLGPRVFSTGLILFNLRAANSYSRLSSYADALRIGRRQFEIGATMLKSYRLVSREQRQWALRAARETGLGVTAEGVHSIADYLELAVDGHSAIEHFYTQEEVYADVGKLIAKIGTSVNGTLLVIGSPSGRQYIESCGGQPEDTRSKLLILPREIRSTFKSSIDCNAREGFQWYETSRALSNLISHGVKVSIGSHGNVPGLGTHWEMWLLAEGGTSAAEVIRAATITGAEKLGLQEEIGSIEEGKLADFLVLNCNPIENIRCTADIEYVVKNGFVWHADSMTQMWPEYKPLPKLWWHSDEDWEELKPELPEPWEGVPIADGVALEQASVH